MYLENDRYNRLSILQYSTEPANIMTILLVMEVSCTCLDPRFIGHFKPFFCDCYIFFMLHIYIYTTPFVGVQIEYA